jgi:phosphoenolpyruvate carboxykinase (ATP)
MVRGALAGTLDDVPATSDPVFGVQVPAHVPGVPSEILIARDTWADPAACDASARKLAGMFTDAFQEFVPCVPESVRAAAPRTD